MSPIELPPYSRREEIWNMISHVVGGGISLAFLLLSLIRAIPTGDPWTIVSLSVYGVTMVMLFTVSSLYHGLVPLKAKKVFRVIDHCTIYLLIAGTYTPITMTALREFDPASAWLIFIIIWSSAVLAITLTAVDMNRYKAFSMAAYIVMGWCILLRFSETVQAVGVVGMTYITLGGILYTIGAVIYGVGKKKNTPYVHLAFHLFVVVAAIFQYLGIYLGVLA